MTSQPIAVETFSELPDHLEPTDIPNLLRGIVVGVGLCAPFWAGVYWLVRSLF